MSPGDRRAREAGSVALPLLGGVAMMLVLVIGLSDVALFFLARTRAQTAADSAALAAAAELIPGLGTDPRGFAEAYAQANGARLTDCRCALGSSIAEVGVTVPVALNLASLAGVREVRAESRAEVNLAALP